MNIDQVKVETIYKNENDWEACGWLTYGRGSVLEGQSQEVPVCWFDTLEEAKAKYPKAEVVDHRRLGSQCGDGKWGKVLPDSAPDWFDPADAGERWSDDY